MLQSLEEEDPQALVVQGLQLELPREELEPFDHQLEIVRLCFSRPPHSLAPVLKALHSASNVDQCTVCRIVLGSLVGKVRLR
jgi:hypothetical protein